jgi:hypothetical protein
MCWPAISRGYAARRAVRLSLGEALPDRPPPPPRGYAAVPPIRARVTQSQGGDSQSSLHSCDHRWPESGKAATKLQIRSLLNDPPWGLGVSTVGGRAHFRKWSLTFNFSFAPLSVRSCLRTLR